jgi:transposase-like protein
VLWRLRYKLSLTDLAEMFSVEFERFYFTRATIWRWQEKFAPLITDELKSGRKGEADKRWKADETLVKVAGKFNYLYRAIDSRANWLKRNCHLKEPWKALRLSSSRLSVQLVINRNR